MRKQRERERRDWIHNSKRMQCRRRMATRSVGEQGRDEWMMTVNNTEYNGPAYMDEKYRRDMPVAVICLRAMITTGNPDQYYINRSDQSRIHRH